MRAAVAYGIARGLDTLLAYGALKEYQSGPLWWAAVFVAFIIWQPTQESR